MSGREKIKCYQYDMSGRYIRSFNSIAEVRDKYYPEYDGKYPILRNKDSVLNQDYHVLPDSTVIFKNRVYRDNVVMLFYRLNNPLVFENNDKKEICMCNMDGKIIATFLNVKVASILTGMPYTSIYNSVLRGKGKVPKNKLRVSFKYTNND